MTRIQQHWDWKIRSYDADGNFCLETVHSGNFSRDMELEVIRRLGRRATVEPLSDMAVLQWEHGWRPAEDVAL